MEAAPFTDFFRAISHGFDLSCGAGTVGVFKADEGCLEAVLGLLGSSWFTLWLSCTTRVAFHGEILGGLCSRAARWCEEVVGTHTVSSVEVGLIFGNMLNGMRVELRSLIISSVAQANILVSFTRSV